MNEYLTPSELHQLTGYARSRQQDEWLKEHGVPHRVDGKRIIVSRVHVLQWIEGKPLVSGGINFASVR